MLPTRLVLDDFFGFSHHEFDLSGIHVGVIVGRNGAGKSSIFDAIRWVLYGRYRESGGDLVIRRRAARARVEMHFTARGDKWVVVREKPRGKTATLRLTRTDGAETGHTIAETQARIEQLVGLSYAAFMAGPMMVQDAERGDLMALDPRARKELVIEEADVQGYEALHVAAKARVAEAEFTLRSLTVQIEADRRALDGEEAARAALETARQEVERHSAAQSLAHERITEAKIALAAAEAKAAGDAQLASRERSIRNAIAQAGEDRERWGIAATRARVAMSSRPTPEDIEPVAADALVAARDRVAKVSEARVERAILTATQTSMRDDAARFQTVDVPCGGVGPYAACPLLRDFAWNDEKRASFRGKWNEIAARLVELDLIAASQNEANDDLKRLDSADRRYRESLAAFGAAKEAAKKARDAGRVTLAEAEASIERVKNELARMTGDLDQVMAERAGAELARDEVARARRDGQDAQRAYDVAHRAIADIEPVLARAQAVVAEMETIKERMPQTERDLDAAGRERETFVILAAAFHRDGIPSMVIAYLLPQIEARANEVLARMPEEMTLRLSMGNVTKSGTISDRLDIAVTHEGDETSFGMLSGAQQFRVNLALRLGQQRVLAARSGASIEFLFLDEADRDLDEEGLESLVETINAVSDEFGLILLISHHDWLIERLPSQVRVTRAHGQSQLEVA